MLISFRMRSAAHESMRIGTIPEGGEDVDADPDVDVEGRGYRASQVLRMNCWWMGPLFKISINMELLE